MASDLQQARTACSNLQAVYGGFDTRSEGDEGVLEEIGDRYESGS